jgi:hypothetical protein
LEDGSQSSPGFQVTSLPTPAAQPGGSSSPQDNLGGSNTRGHHDGQLEQQPSPSFFLTAEFTGHLLQLYFNFVHNVWPVIYKPAFHISRAKPVLTKAILAIAACIDKSVGLDIDALFDEAEHALLASRLHSHIETVQALILMSLRQTGCGNKSSAWMYAGMLRGFHFQAPFPPRSSI